MNKLERKSSMESEPLTLDFNQIQNAREAALSVVNTKTFEEALKIFMEGLKPMVRGKMVLEDYSDEEEWDNYDFSRDSILGFCHSSTLLLPATAPF